MGQRTIFLCVSLWEYRHTHARSLSLSHNTILSRKWIQNKIYLRLATDNTRKREKITTVSRQRNEPRERRLINHAHFTPASRPPHALLFPVFSHHVSFSSLPLEDLLSGEKGEFSTRNIRFQWLRGAQCLPAEWINNRMLLARAAASAWCHVCLCPWPLPPSSAYYLPNWFSSIMFLS